MSSRTTADVISSDKPIRSINKPVVIWAINCDSSFLRLTFSYVNAKFPKQAATESKLTATRRLPNPALSTARDDFEISEYIGSYAINRTTKIPTFFHKLFHKYGFIRITSISRVSRLTNLRQSCSSFTDKDSRTTFKLLLSTP